MPIDRSADVAVVGRSIGTQESAGGTAVLPLVVRADTVKKGAKLSHAVKSVSVPAVQPSVPVKSVRFSVPGELQPAPVPVSLPVPVSRNKAAVAPVQDSHPPHVLVEIPPHDQIDDDVLLSMVVTASHQSIPMGDCACFAALLMGGFGEPRSIQEAQRTPHSQQWMSAVDVEMGKMVFYEALLPIVSLPAGAKALPSQFVFTNKFGTLGEIIDFRARLVLGGHRQLKNVHFDAAAIYSPVAGMETWKMMLSSGAANHRYICIIDVSAAFLQGDRLQEEVFMRLPKGCTMAGGTTDLVQVQVGIYGMKQAPVLFYNHLTRSLATLGLVPSVVDPCLFTRDVGTPNMLLICVVVDDLTCVANDVAVLHQFEASFGKLYKLSKAEHFGLKGTRALGIVVVYDRVKGVITLSQRDYVMRVLDRFGMADCKPSPTPMVTGGDCYLHYDTSPKLDVQQYVEFQSMIGCLLYLTVTTRSDIMYGVNRLAAFMTANANLHHVEMAKRVLRYLQGTAALVLQYQVQPPAYHDQLYSMCDANYGGEALDVANACSISGLVIMFNGGVVLSKSTKQKMVVLSSTESEYVALNVNVKKQNYLGNLALQLGAEQKLPMLIFEDNTSAIAIASQKVSSQRTRHLHIQMHYIREQVQLKRVQIVHMRTENMVADMNTKALDRVKYERFRDMMLGLRPVDIPAGAIPGMMAVVLDDDEAD